MIPRGHKRKEHAREIIRQRSNSSKRAEFKVNDLRPKSEIDDCFCCHINYTQGQPSLRRGRHNPPSCYYPAYRKQSQTKMLFHNPALISHQGLGGKGQS